jgi:hypothetical protein
MYLIPDIPYKVKMQMLRENFLSKEALYQAESIKYNPMRGGTPNNGTDITNYINRFEIVFSMTLVLSNRI